MMGPNGKTIGCENCTEASESNSFFTFANSTFAPGDGSIPACLEQKLV